MGHWPHEPFIAIIFITNIITIIPITIITITNIITTIIIITIVIIIRPALVGTHFRFRSSVLVCCLQEEWRSCLCMLGCDIFQAGSTCIQSLVACRASAEMTARTCMQVALQERMSLNSMSLAPEGSHEGFLGHES